MRTEKTLIRLGDTQADLSLHWVHTYVISFVVSRLILKNLSRFDILDRMWNSIQVYGFLIIAFILITLTDEST